MRPSNFFLPSQYMASSLTWDGPQFNGYCIASYDIDLPANLPEFKLAGCSERPQSLDFSTDNCQDEPWGQEEHPIWSRSSPCIQGTKEVFCVFTSTDFAGRDGIAIVTTRRNAENMADLPAFRDFSREDVTHDNPAPPFSRKWIPGKGYGLVANRLINRGDRILSNGASTMLDYKAFQELEAKDLEALQVEMVGHLPPQHQQRYMSLSTQGETDLSHEQRMGQVMKTNSFDVTVMTEEEPFFFALFTESES